MRCNSVNGYTYDMNIYTGKEMTIQEGTLRERAVRRLCSTIKERDITLAFHRFFTCFFDGYTAIHSCWNMHEKSEKSSHYEYSFTTRCSRFLGKRTLAASWIDTKEVFVPSNCHDAGMTKVNKKQKEGLTKKIPCAEAIKFLQKSKGGRGELALIYQIRWQVCTSYTGNL